MAIRCSSFAVFLSHIFISSNGKSSGKAPRYCRLIKTRTNCVCYIPIKIGSAKLSVNVCLLKTLREKYKIVK